MTNNGQNWHDCAKIADCALNACQTTKALFLFEWLKEKNLPEIKKKKQEMSELTKNSHNFDCEKKDIFL